MQLWRVAACAVLLASVAQLAGAACAPGYKQKPGGSCVNINECTTGAHQCVAPAQCRDTVGSYTCECPVGFVGTGSWCLEKNLVCTGEWIVVAWH